MDTLTTRVKQVMAAAFEAPLEAIDEDASIGVTPGWDSLGHATLMLALEEEFGVEIPPQAVVDLQSLPEVVSFLSVQGVHEG